VGDKKEITDKAPPVNTNLYLPPARRYRAAGGALPVSVALPPFVLSAPGNVAVTSVTVTSQSHIQVNVAWSAAGGSVNHYLIERGTSLSGSFDPIGTAASSATTYTDDFAPGANVHSYLYRVRAVDAFGAPSLPSNMGLGTVIAFTDPTLTAGVTDIKKEHIYELRYAVDAVRALVPNMSAGAYARSDLYHQIVKAEEINELRDQLNQALLQLGIAIQSYDDTPLATGANGTPIRKKHIEQIRERSTYGQSTSSGPTDPTFDASTTARLDPMNRVGGGDDPLSRNFNWGIGLVSLPGRSGLDLGMGLSYNSLVWTRSGNYIYFDPDGGTPSPGFRLGFPVIKAPYTNSQNSVSYLMITPSGARVELRRVGTSNLYESVDSSHIQLNASTMILRTPDGTQMSYVWEGIDYACTQIKDRNGNYITIHYNDYGWMDWVDDTLGRRINISYNNGDLTSINQSWTVNGQTVSHPWASFSYANQAISTAFSSLTVIGPQNNQSVRVLTSVALADNSHYDFSYTTWGQVWKMNAYATSDTSKLLNYHSYNLPLDNSTAQTDCPRFTVRNDWAANWNRDSNGAAQEAPTTFAVPSATTIPETSIAATLAQVTASDGTSQKIYYGNPSTNLPWENGLVLLSESYDNATTPAKQRWVKMTWTQDAPGSSVTYQLNPRATYRDTYDANNHRQTEIEYYSSGPSFGLPHVISEYGNGACFSRRIFDYKEDSDYVNRHIIGLLFQTLLYDGDWNLQSRTQYAYDEGSAHFTAQTPAMQFDSEHYPSWFIVGRGNLTGTIRFNAANQSETARVEDIGYNQTGSPTWKTDANSNHKVQLNYADNFSDGGNSRNTLAYPKIITDPGNFDTTFQYNFDTGMVTHKQTPSPNSIGTTPGQTILYDSIGRLEKVTNDVNGAYTSYEYGANFVKTYGTVNNLSNEAYSLQVFDGAGRVIATAGNHPNSTAGYRAQLTVYDNMGRTIRNYNPVETTEPSTLGIVNPFSWSPAGDDANVAWPYTEQTYDWKGRPLVTTNQDGTYKSASYAGCGCAGGEVVTLTDEGTIDGGNAKRRQQKIYSDAIGRTARVEVLNWESGTVYSTATNAYNARDQITLIRQYQGTDASGTYQETTMTYDGYGRLSTKHVPLQVADSNNSSTSNHTEWTYNNDDTVATVKEARGATATYTYNSRHLVTGIAYAAPSPIPATSSSSFAYDSAGNRIEMTDASGSTSYSYDQNSRMTSESRAFTESGAPTGTFTLAYEYNLANEPTTVTDQRSGTSFSNVYDTSGRVSSVSGLGYNSTFTQFATQISYRAFGAPKTIAYGNNTSISYGYNSRSIATSFTANFPDYYFGAAYQYYADEKLKFSQNQATYPAPVTDRAYSYDLAGRLGEAYSGAQARDFVNSTTSGVVDGPYRQTYSYDVWGNTTNVNWRFWSRNGATPATYNSANRNVAWTYDAQGNLLTRGDSAQYFYDASGRGVKQTSENHYYDAENSGYVGLFFTNTETYDGDGQQVHYVKSMDHNFNAGSHVSGPVSNVFQLRSTVLGGGVISEYMSDGTWMHSYVYAGSQRIGDQTLLGGNWRYADPVTGDENGSVLDPQGVDVGIEDPFPPNGAGDPDGLVIGSDPIKVKNAALLPIEGGGTQCVLDGISMDCSFIRGESSVQCPNNDCGPRVLEKHDGRTGELLGHVLSQPFQAWADGWSGFLPPGARYQDNGRYSMPGEFDPDNLRPSTGVERNHAPQLGALRMIKAYQDCTKQMNRNVPVPAFDRASLIAEAARAEKQSPEFLAVSVSVESSVWFTGGDATNGPHGGGTADVGPGQLDYGSLKDWSVISDLENVWGSNTGVGQTFNGSALNNLRASARYINDLGGGRDGTIHYHSGKGPWLKKPDGQRALKTRTDEYDKRAPSYHKLFECLHSSIPKFF
jgi:YD repeat-containing protein